MREGIVPTAIMLIVFMFLKSVVWCFVTMCVKVVKHFNVLHFSKKKLTIANNTHPTRLYWVAIVYKSKEF